VPIFDQTTIRNLIEPILASKNAFCVGLNERNERGQTHVQLFVDTDQGITIAECTALSREIRACLDGAGISDESYELEISSPGIDQPLKLLRQYKKNLGRRFKVKHRLGDTQSSFTGVLLSVEGNRLTFGDGQKESVTIEFENIIESTEELPW
jgi:ribosome maturation factor RimP